MANTIFNPVQHGFHFSNSKIPWSFGPFSGTALCGGMAYAALDYFLRRIPIPTGAQAPAEGTQLQSYIYDRQVAAHGNTVATFAAMFTPILGNLFQDISLSVQDEFDKLRSILATGCPWPICLFGGVLIFTQRGHHILAIGCNDTRPIMIQAYDPNAPDRIAMIQTISGGNLQNSASSEVWSGFFIDRGYQADTPTFQDNWRWCRKCQGLFFFGNPTNGVCPATGSHDVIGSGNYTLWLNQVKNQPQSQADWRWCRRCEGLFFIGNAGNTGVCPAGPGGHDATGSGNYILALGGGAGQPAWRWCRNCQGLYFAGNGVPGVCPASKTGHDPSASGGYILPVSQG